MDKRSLKSLGIDTDEDEELPGIWGKIQGAIWLIGIAVLAWQGWWWPGILILVAISGVTQMFLRRQAVKEHDMIVAREEEARSQTEERALHTARAEALPARCPACGAPLSAASVNWRTPTTATCPYCDTAVKAA